MFPRDKEKQILSRRQGGERCNMGALDVDKLLEPVSDDLPSGEDLEYDEQFGALERTAEGKPGHVMGDEEIPPEPPKWDEVSDAALELLGRTCVSRRTSLMRSLTSRGSRVSRAVCNF